MIINEITVGAPFRVRDQTVVKSTDFGVYLIQGEQVWPALLTGFRRE